MGMRSAVHSHSEWNLYKLKIMCNGQFMTIWSSNDQQPTSQQLIIIHYTRFHIRAKVNYNFNSIYLQRYGIRPYGCVAPTHSSNIFISLVSNLILFLIYGSFVCAIVLTAHKHSIQRSAFGVRCSPEWNWRCVCVCACCSVVFIYLFHISFSFSVSLYSECWIIAVKVYLPSTVTALISCSSAFV